MSFIASEWEIPQSKINKKLDNLERILNLIKSNQYNQTIQTINIKLSSIEEENIKYKYIINELMKKLENSLAENKIMYVELLKMHKKFHLETKNILENHKKTITQQLGDSNLGYKEILNVLQDNKVVLSNIETLGFEDIKPMLDKMKNNNKKIKNNLSSAMLKYRNDNLFWRSYSNKFSKNVLDILKND